MSHRSFVPSSALTLGAPTPTLAVARRPRVRLQQRFLPMADLGPEQRLSLARIRASRNHPLPPGEEEAERDRFLRSLDFYTHVTLGMDPRGRIRSFAAYRWELHLDWDQPAALLFGGPHFRERGTQLGGQELGLVRLTVPAMLRHPRLTLVFGSAVSIQGFATVLRAVRGTVPVHIFGDEAVPALSQAMLDRLKEGPQGATVDWLAQRKVLRYAAGPALRAGDLDHLDAAERARYLALVPEALGPDNGLSALVAFQGSAWDVLRFLGRLAVDRLVPRALRRRLAGGSKPRS